MLDSHQRIQAEVCEGGEVNNYFDKYLRLHDKPVTEDNPCPCNNAWTYTAFLSKMRKGLVYNSEAVMFCIDNMCRHPFDFINETKVLMSRDEILGMAYLD
ncbi:MAG: hypothetical protein ACEQSA_06480, partial [Weeksellaceae bacterium]